MSALSTWPYVLPYDNEHIAAYVLATYIQNMTTATNLHIGRIDVEVAGLPEALAQRSVQQAIA